ncbi:MAG: DegT/DnrJ/EryC1/StrS family aminotransferase [Candidatus Altarchaeaceae archaeon]
MLECFNVKYAIAVSSGTTALHITLIAMGIK